VGFLGSALSAIVGLRWTPRKRRPLFWIWYAVAGRGWVITWRTIWSVWSCMSRWCDTNSGRPDSRRDQSGNADKHDLPPGVGKVDFDIIGIATVRPEIAEAGRKGGE